MSLFFVLSAPGAAKPLPPTESPVAAINGRAFDTAFELRLRCGALTPEACLSAGAGAATTLDRLAPLFDERNPTSPLVRLNRQAGRGPVLLPPEVVELLGQAGALARLTAGNYDPTIETLRSRWRFATGTLPDPADLQARQEAVGWRKIDLYEDTASLLHEQTRVTLDGVLFGWALHQAQKALPADMEASIQLGGTALSRGCWSEEIPGMGGRDLSSGAPPVPLLLTLCDAGLAVVDDQKEAFEVDGRRFHARIDPHTGLPARGARSVVVVHRDAATAEALAEALLVVGPIARIVTAAGAWAYVITHESRLPIELGARGTLVRDLR